MIRAVFLDIDGTLISVRTHAPAPRTAQALLRAKERGILLFVATGRHTAVREEGYILDLLPDCFDGFVGLTGHYCYTRQGEVVRKQPLDPGDVRRVKEVAGKHRIPYTYAYHDKALISHVDDRVRRHNASLDLPIPPVMELDPSQEVYSITLYIDKADEMNLIRPQLRHSTTVSWMEGIADLCGPEGGKSAGILAMLKRFHLSPEEALAVGDSDNDLTMFECLGSSAAMGGCTPALRAVADYVAAPCEEDGIYDTFQHFKLL